MTDPRFRQLQRCGLVAVFAIPIWMVVAAAVWGNLKLEVASALVAVFMQPLTLAAKYLWDRSAEDEKESPPANEEPS